MLKSSFKSGEGIALMLIIANCFGIVWWKLTQSPPPVPDYEMLLAHAKTAEDVSLLLKQAAGIAQPLDIDWEKLGITGGIGGLVGYVYQYFTKSRSNLKKNAISAHAIDLAKRNEDLKAQNVSLQKFIKRQTDKLEDSNLE